MESDDVVFLHRVQCHWKWQCLWFPFIAVQTCRSVWLHTARCGLVSPDNRRTRQRSDKALIFKHTHMWTDNKLETTMSITRAHLRVHTHAHARTHTHACLPLSSPPFSICADHFWQDGGYSVTLISFWFSLSNILFIYLIFWHKGPSKCSYCRNWEWNHCWLVD